MELNRTIQGDAATVLATLPDGCVHCCISSPPYWGLRDYGVAGQIGLEATLGGYLDRLLAVMAEVRRVLRDDGTLWLNLGDAYSGAPGEGHKSYAPGQNRTAFGRGPIMESKKRQRGRQHRIPAKNLLGLPWRVAFALQDAGWMLRSDIIWCLSGGTWLYARTQKGEMPAMLRDLVRLDPATVQLWNGEKWARVVSWSESRGSGDKLELVLRSGERIGCTGTHLWPTQRGLVKAGELAVGDRLQYGGLPEPKSLRCPIYLTPDLLWLIGLYLAEGSRSEDTIQLSLAADETAWLPRISAAADSVGASTTHTLSGNVLNVRLYGRVLNAIIDEYIGGRTARDKHFRNTAWRLSNEALRMLVQGYLDGDAHHDGARYRLGFTRNYYLERDLRIASARLGATVTIKPSFADYQGGRRATFRGEWRWSRSGHWSEKDRCEIVAIRRSRARRFYDVEVADEPHLFALASGVLTHNSKPNPMPESVRDRPTRAHEYVFLLSKAERYWYDADAVRTPSVAPTRKMPDGWDTGSGAHGSFHRQGREAGKSPGYTKRDGGYRKNGMRDDGRLTGHRHAGFEEWDARKRHDQVRGGANLRDTWNIATQPFRDAHFATFPEALVERCLLAGCPEGGTVLDPFHGSGTVGLVARKLDRNYLGVELNPEYVRMADERIANDGRAGTLPLF